MATQSPQTFIPIADPALQVFEPTVVLPPQGFGTANVTVVEIDQRTTNTYKVNNIVNSPGGTVAQVQYNNGGVFGGDAEFTYNAVTNSLQVTGNVTSGNFIGSGAGLTGVTASFATNAGFATTAGTATNAGFATNAGTATVANSVDGANVSGAVGLATYATTANAVAGANVSGEVTFAATANAVAGANVSGAVGSATTAGTVTTAAQPNVTSVGTLTGVTVASAATVVGGGSTVGAASTLTVDPAFGSNDWNAPASAQAVRGRVTGADLTKTHNYVVGTTGTYNVTGTNASLFPKVGVLGVIGDTTTTADAAFMAFVDGDGGETRAAAAYGVGMINSTSNSGFDYGLDLQFFNSGVPSTTNPFKQADIRLNNGVKLDSGTADTLTVSGNVVANNVHATFMVRTIPTTIELLGAATGLAGARAWITNCDSTLVTANLLVVAANTGSGANSVPVFSDGSNWLIG
jgi:hypothetical protein